MCDHWITSGSAHRWSCPRSLDHKVDLQTSPPLSEFKNITPVVTSPPFREWCHDGGDATYHPRSVKYSQGCPHDSPLNLFKCPGTFHPSFIYWWHKITKAKESNKCDLCKALWITEGRFNTDDDLPIQTLGHIQHQCEALSEIHTLIHHRYCRIIHAELGRLTSSKWRFVCINGEKNLKTIWKLFNFYLVQTLENATMGQERNRPLTEAEKKKHKADTPIEKIMLDRIWNKRPDGFAIKMPTKTKTGELVILEFKHMSCVTDQYVTRSRIITLYYIHLITHLQGEPSNLDHINFEWQ